MLYLPMLKLKDLQLQNKYNKLNKSQQKQVNQPVHDSMHFDQITYYSQNLEQHLCTVMYSHVLCADKKNRRMINLVSVYQHLLNRLIYQLNNDEKVLIKTFIILGNLLKVYHSLQTAIYFVRFIEMIVQFNKLWNGLSIGFAIH